ncbi:putative selenate reductase subunit YgfK [Ruminococcaceae bacterium OttesenSCG-928-O06]|nr:putative selenate reductase subunit YgfK [Ruminococcaceae bacterium OttesenSCG-928-O06]
MSEIMRPMPFAKLMRWALTEYGQQKRVFGINEDKFYRGGGAGISIFGQAIASPIGPAAGPNSQLAQNILAAWLCGSRFIELKTVQKMDGDELRAAVPRPCINAQDEGYNVEWSTELTVQQAFDEYVKAWLAIHVLSKELDIAGGTDVVFNMSVGYDLDGIKTPKIDNFIEGLKNAAATPVFGEGIAWLRGNAALLSHCTPADIDAIPAKVSDSVTLSTLHGCPPAEIERIANYLLCEKNVHTFIKCNPTLLGYKTARRLLDEMGYSYVSFDEHHFQNDLQYDDAVAMLARLMKTAEERKLSFGVKITNTFPVQITGGTLPGEEMYMSGRALFPLSITVASRLSQHFEGKLPISYSGGADAFNIEAIFKTGIRPITVATTVLKPGGYERMHQLATALAPLATPQWNGIDVAALSALAESVTALPAYRKEKRPVQSRKTQAPLGLYDCYMAPCKSGGCPIEQQIPEYLQLVSEEKYLQAFRVIAIDNALPGITGTLCNHACQGKCTRLDYDDPLQIRAAKLRASDNAQLAYTIELLKEKPAIKTQKKAVVVGAGPAGVAAAVFLRRAGMAVTVLEKRAEPFGIVNYVIPAFRIPFDAMRRDFDLAKTIGVEFQFDTEAGDIAALRQSYDYVVLATGAWKEGAAPVEEGAEKLLDALAFLEESKAKKCEVELGKRVAVIGGGDVAMDCARAAKRAPGVEDVTIVYRRTREFMPAEKEEIALALEEGVNLMELRAPLRFDGATLCCEEMELGAWDESGRRSITGCGTQCDLPFDTVICAVGARVDTTPFEAAGIALTARGLPETSPAGESSHAGVYIAGDCKTGPATVVGAIADAKAIAKDICAKEGLDAGFVKAELDADPAVLQHRKGILAAAEDEPADAARCLGCEMLCEICCDVCPNRANVRIALPGFANAAQILHIDGLCNECGNCGIFCPHKGDPYKDKLTLFWSEEDFMDSQNKGFLKMPDEQYMIRLEDGSVITAKLDDKAVPPQMAAFIGAVQKEYAYYI